MSEVRISGRTVKELLDHFPRPEKRSRAYDEPMLIWEFGEDTVSIKTENRWASTTSSRGKKSWKAKDMDEDDDDDRPCES